MEYRNNIALKLKPYRCYISLKRGIYPHLYLLLFSHKTFFLSIISSAMSKNISLNRGQELSTKDPLERQRCKKAADDAEKIMRQMDQLGEVIGAWNTVIMVLSRDKEDFQNRCTRVESIANTLGCKVRILSNLQKEGYQQLSPTYTQNKQIAEISSRPPSSAATGRI